MSDMTKVIRGDYVEVDGHDTIAKLFRQRCKLRGDQIAMREKDMGIWQTYSWNDYYNHACIVAGGLKSLGFERGDVVSILSEDNKEWVFSDLGTIVAGGVTNGIYPTYQGSQIEHIMKDSNTRILFVENEEQLDKYLSVRDQLPNVKKVIVYDWKGLRGFKDDTVIPLGAFYDLGKQYLSDNPGFIDESIDLGKNDDVIILIYTSGTTGNPKGTEVANRYMLFQTTMAPDPFNVLPSDEVLTYLPLCHAAERLFSVMIPMAHGTTINFAESPETIFQNIQELSPTMLFAVPRIWEKFYSRIQTLMSESTWVGKKAYEWAFKVGFARADYLIEKKPVPSALELQYKIAERFVYRNLKQLLGLDRARYLISGAAPISADLLKWYYAFGLTVSELYGQTETGMATCVPKGEFKPGTIGKPCPNVEVRIGEQNEIMVKSAGVMTGYRNNEESTNSTKVNGWIHTGDVGEITEDGYVRITDRLKDIIITAGGKNITPSLIENRLKFSSYISDACVIGDKRKYLTCLIMIDQENVEHFAQTNSIPFTDYKSLCASPEVLELIQKEVDDANTHFASVEQVKRFRLIDVLLTAEDDELTPTMKLKRSFVSEKYKDLINSMY